MDSVLEQMKASPILPKLLAELNTMLANEKALRTEFYNAITEDDKAEFISGEIVMHSPVMLRHSNASQLIYRAMSTFVDLADAGVVSHEKSMMECSRNSYEPDVAYWGKHKADKFTPQQLLFPPADLVVEITSKSTEANDRGVKFEDYAAHGIGEYWIVNPEQRTVEQYLLEEAVYVLAEKKKAGIIESMVLKGFNLPVPAVFDKAANMAFVKQLLAA